MKRDTAKNLIHALVPLTLLVIFTLFICFPSDIPFLSIKPSSYKGIGTIPFSVPVPVTKEAKKGLLAFSLKKVPPGVSPAGCTDIAGGTVVTAPYSLGETEVTGALWDAVTAHPAAARYVFTGKQVYGPTSDSPVAGVSWRDAIVFCNALSAVLDLAPVYRFADGSKVDGPVTSVLDLESFRDAVVAMPKANGFRLPSSDEWELAARYIDGTSWTPGSHPSGSSTPYYEDTRSSLYAVFQADSSAPVRSRASNQLGIYDMSGNVWEWCFDTFDEANGSDGAKGGSDGAEAVPPGKHVVRGGTWLGTAYRLQIGGEFGSRSDIIEQGQGFRLARSGW